MEPLSPCPGWEQQRVPLSMRPQHHGHPESAMDTPSSDNTVQTSSKWREKKSGYDSSPDRRACISWMTSPSLSLLGRRVKSLGKNIFLLLIICLVIGQDTLIYKVTGASTHDQLPDTQHIRKETVTERKIFEFHSYRDGQLFHFEVPMDTRKAVWTFKTNFSIGCRPGLVTIHLQAGGYPVVNSDYGRYPDGMKPLSIPYNITFNPENGVHTLHVPSPLPGDWFMLAYLKKNERNYYGYPQEGSPSSSPSSGSSSSSTSPLRCSTWLRTDVEYQLEPNIIHLFPEKHNHQKLFLYDSVEKPQTYKFFTGDNVWLSSVTLTKCGIKSDIRGGVLGGDGRGRITQDACPIRLSVAPRRPPDTLDSRTRHRDCLKDSDSSGCSLKLYVEENSWHYITVTPTRANLKVGFAINVVITDCPHPTQTIDYLLVNKVNPHEICSDITKNSRSSLQLLFPPYSPKYDLNDVYYKKCGQRIRLVRKTMPGVFMFEYHLPIVGNNSNPSLTLDLENDLPSILQFPVGVSDIGGSLVVELGINIGRLSGIGSENIQLKACLSHGRRLVPTMASHFDPYSNGGVPKSMLEPLHPVGVKATTFDKEEASLCPGGRLISLNVSADEQIPNIQRISVPYPAAGEWFLTLLPSCSKINIRKANGETTYESTSCSRNITPIVFSIYSDMCIMGGCGKYGRCYQFFSGGNMFSTCTCFAGYKGWGCSDEREATSEIDLLAATLLLCLSNLVFLPAVGLAIYRGFYTESFIYFANMVFSTLYHACDQDVFSFCLMKYSVMQFCDYYSATMSYWVTVLAMAGLPDQAKSLLHMVGAVGIALAIEHDRMGIFTFLIPGLFGLLIMISSWISHCSTDRSCYPGFKYICCFFLPGLAVLFGGLFCFMVLEHETNYQFVHSAWQISMAIAILFLLPQSPNDGEDKYTMLDTRPPPTFVESSFKHYSDENGPEVINVTSSGTILPPDQVIDVSRAPSVATLNNGTLGRSTLPRSGHSTLKKPDESRYGHGQFPYEPG